MKKMLLGAICFLGISLSINAQEKGGNSSRDRERTTKERIERADKNCVEKQMRESGGIRALEHKAKDVCDWERVEKGDREYLEKHDPPAPKKEVVYKERPGRSDRN